MQPTFFSSVRTNLSRSISPHLASPTSPSPASSSIRSLSPGRRSPQLRSRSASPSPRRFASVLAYHATPPIDGHGKKRTISAEQGESEHHVSDNSSRETRDRAESPSQIAVRNLEESWRRFELEATTPLMNHSPSSSSPSSSPSSSSSITSTHPTVGSPLSPSPLSKPPYRELIECTAFKDKTSAIGHGMQESETKEVVSEAGVTGTASRAVRASKPSLTKSIIGESNDIYSHHPTHGRTDTAAISKPTRANADSLTSSSSNLKTSSSTPSGTTATTAVSDHHHPQSEPQQHQEHENMNTFLASAEARHILDMPSLLGKDPNMIPNVMAMPIPIQPRRSKAAASSSSTTTTTTSAGTNTTPASQLISELDAKAESTAKAMTKRYAAKNLNMTETEAHRMVQIMAAEIVVLHEERDAMLQKMEKAKQEMLAAAKLLRIKANAEANNVEEFQDMSAEGRGKMSGTAGSRDMRVKNVDDNDEASDKRTHNANVYDKDEWRDRE